jgi:hypothetical protein
MTNIMGDLSQDLSGARKLLHWMAAGIVPSMANVSWAAQAVADHAERHDLDLARRMLAFANVGVLPSQENCMAAADQVAQAMQEQEQEQEHRFERMR